jgi:hypothetical protein
VDHRGRHQGRHQDVDQHLAHQHQEHHLDVDHQNLGELRLGLLGEDHQGRQRGDHQGPDVRQVQDEYLGQDGYRGQDVRLGQDGIRMVPLDASQEQCVVLVEVEWGDQRLTLDQVEAEWGDHQDVHRVACLVAFQEEFHLDDLVAVPGAALAAD